MNHRVGSICLIIYTLLFLMSCATSPKATFYQTGMASWYGGKFHGRQTASGEKFNKNDLTAAHRTLAFGTNVVVHSKSTNRSVTVRINDRGPFAKNRIIDLSEAAAGQLGIIQMGEANVEIYIASE